MFDNHWYTRILEQSFNYSSFCYIHENISCLLASPTINFLDCLTFLTNRSQYYIIMIVISRVLESTTIHKLLWIDSLFYILSYSAWLWSYFTTNYDWTPCYRSQSLLRQATGYPPHPFFLSATVLSCHCRFLLLGFCYDSWFDSFQHKWCLLGYAHIGTSNGYQIYLYEVHVGKLANDFMYKYQISTTRLVGSTHPGIF